MSEKPLFIQIHDKSTVAASGAIHDRTKLNEGGPDTGPAYGGVEVRMQAYKQLVKEGALICTPDGKIDVAPSQPDGSATGPVKA